MEIIIDPEFSSLIPPPTKDEEELLEASIINEGCREKLVIWKDTKILLDGHTRYKICKKHNKIYYTVNIQLENREAAFKWMINNQLGRRNLTPEAASVLRGKRYLREKKKRGGKRKSSDQNDHLKTSERLASEYKVSPPTIRRDAKFAQAVDTIVDLTEDGEEIKKDILTRDARISKRDVLKIAKMAKNNPDQAKDVLTRFQTGEAQNVKQAKILIEGRPDRDEPQPALPGPFQVIVVDPPWPQVEQKKNGNNQDTTPDSGLTIKDICKLPVREMADEDCILFLWVPNTHMRYAFRVLDAWSFKEKTILTWIKNRADWGKELCDKTEQCILAVRGNAGTKFTDRGAVLDVAQKEDFRKPEQFYKLVESLSEGRKVELFASQHREGWDKWEPGLLANETIQADDVSSPNASNLDNVSHELKQGMLINE